jgi:uncharacterized protein (DUF1501 family)
MEISRRRLLQIGGALTAYGVAGPALPRLERLLSLDTAADAMAVASPRLLVLLLAGGNDGLNTVVPYELADYYASRPDIAIPAGRVLPLGGAGIGLHPALSQTHALYQSGQVAVIQGVGYDRPDLSHFGSMDVWQTASPTHDFSTGWLGRWLDATPDGGSAVRAVNVGTDMPTALVGARQRGVPIPAIDTFAFADGGDRDPEPVRLHAGFASCASGPPAGDPSADRFRGSVIDADSVVHAVAALAPTTPHRSSSLPDRVSTAMTLLASPLGVDVAWVTLGGFDDHAGEAANHDRLMGIVDAAIARFASDAAATGTPGRFLLLTTSEFGRRVSENGSRGTDHGTAAPVLAVGSRVAGGVYGQQPRLDAGGLDPDGNMVPAIDLREIYMTVIDDFLGQVSSQQVLLGGPSSTLQPVRFLR